MEKKISEIVKRKANITFTLSHYLLKDLKQLLETGEFANMSELINIALSNFGILFKLSENLLLSIR